MHQCHGIYHSHLINTLVQSGNFKSFGSLFLADPVKKKIKIKNKFFVYTHQQHIIYLRYPSSILSTLPSSLNQKKNVLVICCCLITYMTCIILIVVTNILSSSIFICIHVHVQKCDSDSDSDSSEQKQRVNKTMHTFEVYNYIKSVIYVCVYYHQIRRGIQ